MLPQHVVMVRCRVTVAVLLGMRHQQPWPAAHECAGTWERCEDTVFVLGPTSATVIRPHSTTAVRSRFHKQVFAVLRHIREGEYTGNEMMETRLIGNRGDWPGIPRSACVCVCVCCTARYLPMQLLCLRRLFPILLMRIRSSEGILTRLLCRISGEWYSLQTQNIRRFPVFLVSTPSHLSEIQWLRNANYPNLIVNETILLEPSWPPLASADWNQGMPHGPEALQEQICILIHTAQWSRFLVHFATPMAMGTCCEAMDLETCSYHLVYNYIMIVPLDNL